MGGWVVNVTPLPLYFRERDPVPIVYEAEWAPGQVWTCGGILAPNEIRSPDRPAHSKSLYRLPYNTTLVSFATQKFTRQICQYYVPQWPIQIRGGSGWLSFHATFHKNYIIGR